MNQAIEVLKSKKSWIESNLPSRRQDITRYKAQVLDAEQVLLHEQKTIVEIDAAIAVLLSEFGEAA